MGLSQHSNYDYNGVIFVFAPIDSTLTSYWSSITKVTMSVDGGGENYSASVKSIPYTESSNPNNSQRKVFNINTYTHRLSSSTKYQFSTGTHTCTLYFYTGSTYRTSATVTVRVHASLSSPSITYDETTGNLIVSRSQRSSGTRYFLEIRRKDRNIVNTKFTADEKDYAHTVAMRGVEGGKYNEASPHTSFLSYPDDGATAGSSLDSITSVLTTQNATPDPIDLASQPSLMSTSQSSPTHIAFDTDVQLYFSSYESRYYTVTVPAAGVYSLEISGDSEYWSTTLYATSDFSGDVVYGGSYYGASSVVKVSAAGTISFYLYSYKGSLTIRVRPALLANITPDTAVYIPANSTAVLTMSSSYGPVNKIAYSTPDVLSAYYSPLVDWTLDACFTGRFMAYIKTNQGYTYNDFVVTNKSGVQQYVYIEQGVSEEYVYDLEPYLRTNDITKGFTCLAAFDEQAIYDQYGSTAMSYIKDSLSLITQAISSIRGVSLVTPTPVVIQNCILNRCKSPSWSTLSNYDIRYSSGSYKITSYSGYYLKYFPVAVGDIVMGSQYLTLYFATSTSAGSTTTTLYPEENGTYTIPSSGYLFYRCYSTSTNTPTVYIPNTVTATKSGSLYYVRVSPGQAYRVSRNHGPLYWGTSVAKTNLISADSSYVWYETVDRYWDDSGNVVIPGTLTDECSLIVWDQASSTTYIVSDSTFTLEAISDCWDAQNVYNELFSDYSMVVRIGLDGTLWMGGQGVATSRNRGTSQQANGEGVWYTYRYYEPSGGVSWSMANIALDASDDAESISHVIHEEMAQSLGVGNDCYSHEESIHWDPEYANPDYYTGIDYKIWQILFAKNYNGYTNWQLLNELDLPAIFFKEYSDYDSSAGGYVFKTRDPAGKCKLRSGTYEVYAWCAQHVARSTTGGASGTSAYDGWDSDPYSVRSAPLTLVIEGGWYWADHGINMAAGLSVADVPYTVWNSFVDATAEVMISGTIPNDSTAYGSGAGKSFSDAIGYAKCTGDNEATRTLYAQRFNIVNYIINSSIPTGIAVQQSLTSQVLAEYMLRLEECRNSM